MDAHEQAGKKIGRYELRELLGRGGFGTVYRAYDTRLEVERAIKILHPILNSSPEYISRFAREARLVARMEHPNIVPVYDFDHDSARHFLVMKYMAGGSLSVLIKDGGPLPFKRVLAILRDAAAGLDYAHAQGLVHRDVKPANVLFETGGEARLGDFGFARALGGEETSSLSLSGGLLGTPAYMAPELWRNRPATPSSDVYSLGCLTTEMLTGQVLFSGDSPAEIMTLHVLDGPQFPQQWPADVPPGMEAVLRKALERRPEDRFPSAAEFFQALRGLAEPRGEVAKPAPVVPPKVEPADTAERWRAETMSALRSDDDARAAAALARWLALEPNNTEAIAIQVEMARRRVEQGEKGRFRRALGDVRQAAEEQVAAPQAIPPAPVPAASVQSPPAMRQAGPEAYPASPQSREQARDEKKKRRSWVFPGMAFAGVALMALCVAGVALYGTAVSNNTTMRQTDLAAAGVLSPVAAMATTQVAAAEQIFTATALTPTPYFEPTPAPNVADPNLSAAEAEAAIATLSVLQDMARAALAEQVLTQQANPQVGITPSGSTEVQMLDTVRSTWRWVALDSFEGNNNYQWEESSLTNELGTTRIAIQDGAYIFNAQVNAPMLQYAYNGVEMVQDFCVVIDINILGYSNMDLPASAGLMLRSTAAGNYTFEITPNGYFRFGYEDLNNNTWNDIYNWTGSAAINLDGPNQLAVIAQGTDMWLYINRQFIGGVIDAYAVEGAIFPIMRLYASGDSASVAFDNYELRVP